MLRAVLTAALAAMVTVGCAGDTRRQIPPAQVALTGIDQIDNVGETTPVGDAPATKSGLARLPTMERRFDLPQQPDLSARFATDDKKTIAVAAMPMRQFLNYVYGELL